MTEDRRHMVCTSPNKASDCVCIGCVHQAVHFETHNCLKRCARGSVCVPVEGGGHGV